MGKQRHMTQWSANGGAGVRAMALAPNPRHEHQVRNGCGSGFRHRKRPRLSRAWGQERKQTGGPEVAGFVYSEWYVFYYSVRHSNQPPPHARPSPLAERSAFPEPLFRSVPGQRTLYKQWLLSSSGTVRSQLLLVSQVTSVY